MREVKFRAKDAETGEWLYGSLIQRMGYFPSILYPVPTTNGKIRYIETCVDKETIGQYTGFKDKNGVEIYDGDIVRLDNGQYEKISWDTLSYQLLLALAENPDGLTNLLIGGFFDGIEVIDNIFDNKELLGNKEE